MKKEIANLKQRMTAIMGAAAELCGQLDNDKQSAVAMVTTQFEAAYKSLLILEGILIPASELKKAQAKKKYGKYGWVRLRDDEYANLVKELGEVEVKRCIAYIDERAQITANKSKWHDWNLVIHNCTRKKWGIKPWGAPAPKEPSQADIDAQAFEKDLIKNFMAGKS